MRAPGPVQPHGTATPGSTADDGGARAAGHRPGGGDDAWAAIDRAVVDAAATIPFSASLQHDFVSRRVGNVLVQPGFGPLIAQMWVQ